MVLTFFLPSPSLICLKDDSVKEKVAYPSTSFYLGKLILRDKLCESKVTDNRIHSGQTQDNRFMPVFPACLAVS